MAEFQDLVKIMEKLRSPGGCPWDREQTHSSLREYLLEETCEVLEKIDEDDREGLKEELGDLLLQIVFHAQIAKENGDFTIHDVIDAICEKLIRRHPHVFGNEKAKTPEDVSVKWHQIKEKEGKVGSESILQGVPRTLPSLHRCYKLTKRAARVGFDWERVEQIFDKLSEEKEELLAAIEEGDRERIEDEVGDLLFVTANIARFLGVNPELALAKTNRKFEERFNYIEKNLNKNGESLEEASLERMEELWRRAKEEEEKRK
ncbi:MAG: nucleoside triphosphate pyrophosphohydrolase [Deltaproteobacteria bacterium]|nr:MAG: nucleoside triphosphate pyrophosphohydrolase [Deltaproteobacteria bacterium]